ncbi:hypothetical protein ACFX13_016753 [Malus domestica]|uniref:Pectinesterase inhibitor domain-containing protein n=1 Tax=Malus domestica TaxID=3750 RepID=A0A498HVW6_MALDO|nr:hypothetical protein DVH24_012727 [Malus domestica]
MATKTWLITLILSTVFVVGVVGSHYKDPKSERLRLEARDAITLTVNEVTNTRKFVNTIPRLKTLQTIDTPVLVDCVVGLINDLSDTQSVLKRLRHLNKHTSITTDANSLKNMVIHFGRFDNMCQAALRDVDRTILTMLSRKLDDVKLLSDDVIHKVSQLKLNN